VIVIFEMLEIVFILMYFLLPYEEVRLYTNYANIFGNKSETSRDKRVQAGTSRDKQRL
jgi:hypothetical protein